MGDGEPYRRQEASSHRNRGASRRVTIPGSVSTDDVGVPRRSTTSRPPSGSAGAAVGCLGRHVVELRRRDGFLVARQSGEAVAFAEQHPHRSREDCYGEEQHCGERRVDAQQLQGGGQ
jgi:hypothetical protein